MSVLSHQMMDNVKRLKPTRGAEKIYIQSHENCLEQFLVLNSQDLVKVEFKSYLDKLKFHSSVDYKSKIDRVHVSLILNSFFHIEIN